MKKKIVKLLQRKSVVSNMKNKLLPVVKNKKGGVITYKTTIANEIKRWWNSLSWIEKTKQIKILGQMN